MMDAGLVYTPLAVTFFAVSLLAGHLAPRYGRHVLELGAILTMLGFVATIAVAAGFGSSLTPVAIIPTLLVQGVGEGLRCATPRRSQRNRRLRPRPRDQLRLQRCGHRPRHGAGLRPAPRAIYPGPRRS